ncbi:uncharacterized protein LOC113239046 isoform X2 [Hyposmocoma kahamanoa]|uniref:uncharacterized protein LOC113239046 isoform X2 n=1 Tax=Hyposmocoma kahamanoa TaxID=1477025 RepID=UPI000E6D842A|nr:uncharacterized protein LOC113239046 isoform X2 [Hyposmocoma kahamanoa]
MSYLSGYDSEAVGFDSVNQNKRAESNSATQTNFVESGTGCQTNFTKNTGCTTDEGSEDDILKEYPPPGLNDFLRKVVPSMMEQLDRNDLELLYNSSDSEDEDIIVSKLFQELPVKIDMPGLGGGDYQASVLALSWSSAGNSLAVSVGQIQHETWCQHDGLIRIFTVKRSEQDKLVHTLDISEKNCITVVKYHPSVSALLAYGTTSGEVVLCNLRNSMLEDGMQLSSPSGCHGSRRVSALEWANPSLANTFLTAQITKTGKRRGASDQILISAGSDGTMNVWQVNSNLRIFENVICYNINGSKKIPSPDITCFDFIKSCPLRPSDEKVADDIFVVGTKSGKLLLCKIKTDFVHDMVDPVYEELEGHPTCVLNLAFSFQKPGMFASVSMDSELRVYDVNQVCPLKRNADRGWRCGWHCENLGTTRTQDPTLAGRS